MKDFRNVGRIPPSPAADSAPPSAAAGAARPSARALAARMISYSGLSLIVVGVVLVASSPESLPAFVSDTLAPILVVLGVAEFMVGRALARAAQRARG